MLRSRSLLTLVALVSLLGLGSPALAGVPKMVFAEEFGATW